MDITVQKYGGSSLQSPQHFKRVAKRIFDAAQSGSPLVIVVSAPGNFTNDFIDFARNIAPASNPQGLDAALAHGESLSVALLALALDALDLPNAPLTLHSAGIHANNTPGAALIQSIDTQNILTLLVQGKVVIVPGFQALSSDNRVVTLGRGASDLTALALAQALDASSCEILSDVAGVHTSDPRLMPDAPQYESLSSSSLLQLSRAGAQVMHDRAASLAHNAQIPFTIASSFNKAPGTQIDPHLPPLESPTVEFIHAGKPFTRYFIKAESDCVILPALAHDLASLHAVSHWQINPDSTLSISITDPQPQNLSSLIGSHCSLLAQNAGVPIHILGAHLNAHPAISKTLSSIPALSLSSTDSAIIIEVEPHSLDATTQYLHDQLIQHSPNSSACARH